MTYDDLPSFLKDAYTNLDDDSKKYPLVYEGGALRFQRNLAVDWLLNILRKNHIARTAGPTVNDMWEASGKEKWPQNDMRQLYRMMGYRLDGYLEVFPNPEQTGVYQG